MKKIIITAVVLIALVTGIYFATTGFASTTSENMVSAAQPTRLQQTQTLINQLTEQRKLDPSFIAETVRREAELKKMREIDARIDALTIVKTQLDVEISNLETTKK